MPMKLIANVFFVLGFAKHDDYKVVLEKRMNLTESGAKMIFLINLRPVITRMDLLESFRYHTL